MMHRHTRARTRTESLNTIILMFQRHLKLLLVDVAAGLFLVKWKKNRCDFSVLVPGGLENEGK